MQRRTVGTLMLSNALGSAVVLSVIAIVGLLAAEMTGSDLWAGLPGAAATLGDRAGGHSPWPSTRDVGEDGSGFVSATR